MSPPPPARPVDVAPGSPAVVQGGAIDIADENGVPIPAGKVYVVGERVKLKVQSRPPGQALTNITWGIPPETFTKQDYTIPKGEITLWTPQDLQKDTVEFHFAATPQVSLFFVFATMGGKVFTAVAFYTVTGPTDVKLISWTASVQIGFDHAENDWERTLSLTFNEAKGFKGSKQEKLGIEVNGKLTVPDGHWGFIQLIKTYRSHTRFNGQVKVIDSHDDYWLDDRKKVSGPTDVFANDVQEVIPDGGPTFGDAPANALAGDDTVSVAWDYFKLYLVYRPKKPDAAWVTAGKLEWKWGGVAERHPTGWKLVQSDASVNPSGVATYELPVWTDAFQVHSKTEW